MLSCWLSKQVLSGAVNFGMEAKMPGGVELRQQTASSAGCSLLLMLAGILVQLPLPSHISEDVVLSEVSLHKDVDGFHPVNIGQLAMKGRKPLFAPCTPEVSSTATPSAHVVCCQATSLQASTSGFLLINLAFRRMSWQCGSIREAALNLRQLSAGEDVFNACLTREVAGEVVVHEAWSWATTKHHA